MDLFENDEIRELLKSLIRIGEVSDIDPVKGTARVVFDDDDEVVSYNLQVIQRNTYDNQDYAMPDIGEDVVCIFLPTGIEEGFILGSVYAGEVTPPESTGDKRTIVFKDGTKISYDRVEHELIALIEGTSIKANRENIEVVAPKQIKAECDTLDAKAKTSAKLESPVCTVIANTSAIVQSPTITLDGNVNVTGTLTAAVDCIGGGISLKNHTHTGDSGGTTGKPIGG